MSVAVPKEKIIELIEAFFQAGFETEMFNAYLDHLFIVAELRVALRVGKFADLFKALTSLGYELIELKSITTEIRFFGYEIKIRKAMDS